MTLIPTTPKPAMAATISTITLTSKMMELQKRAKTTEANLTAIYGAIENCRGLIKEANDSAAKLVTKSKPVV